MAGWTPRRRTLHFLVEFLSQRRSFGEREIVVYAGGEPSRPATVYLPDRGRLGGAWVVLHGITVPGRHHAAVKRMARALAASGDVVIVPEVPRWTALDVTCRETDPAVRAALDGLAALGLSKSRRVGVMGFSVSAAWALEVAADELGGQVAAVVGMGGYRDLGRMMRAMVVGEHEWEGEVERYEPDPYGRWIMGGALLPLLDDGSHGTREERQAAATALRELAATAGRNGAYSGQPVYDWLIRDLRSALPSSVQATWDLLAPTSESGVTDVLDARRLADTMAQAALDAEPELDPGGSIEALKVPVMLLHGAGDRLVPYTETLRLARDVPTQSLRRATVTKLLGHTKRSEAARLRSPLALGREGAAFVGFVDEMLTMVEPC